MGRAKTYKMHYATRPENCPMCGRPTVIDLNADEAHRLSQPDAEGRTAVPSWQCTSCCAIFFSQEAPGPSGGAAR